MKKYSFLFLAPLFQAFRIVGYSIFSDTSNLESDPSYLLHLDYITASHFTLEELYLLNTPPPTTPDTDYLLEMMCYVIKQIFQPGHIFLPLNIFVSIITVAS